VVLQGGPFAGCEAIFDDRPARNERAYTGTATAAKRTLTISPARLLAVKRDRIGGPSLAGKCRNGGAWRKPGLLCEKKHMNRIEPAYPSRVCPYIGMKNDPKTSFAYPTSGNYCCHCQPFAIPLLEHQGTYCLGDKYKDCPVYEQAANRPLPPQLRMRGHSKRRRLYPK